MSKVFLGGTCNGSSWREKLIPLLNIEYFNPVVKDWTAKCQEEERWQKKNCDIQLYVITPKMTGIFSIAELVDASNKNPKGTVFMILSEDGAPHVTKTQLQSFEALCELVGKNGTMGFVGSYTGLADWVNSYTRLVDWVNDWTPE